MSLKIALTKGRLEKLTVELFEKAGLDCTELRNKGRKLVLPIPDINAEVLLSKPDDVITYIEHGCCDIGVVGKDTILEKGGRFFEVLDLGMGKCRFALANKEGVDFYSGYGTKVIATKYPNIARRFFQSKNMDVEFIKIEGSVEVAPLLGLADGIVDIVETGSTLVANHLEVKEYICDISARVIVNTASLKLLQSEIENFLDLLKNNL
jgi:ATP phosphoribosyltransferase